MNYIIKNGFSRFLFANYTSSLLPVNSTLLLLGALALAGLAGQSQQLMYKEFKPLQLGGALCSNEGSQRQ